MHVAVNMCTWGHATTCIHAVLETNVVKLGVLNTKETPWLVIQCLITNFDEQVSSPLPCIFLAVWV